MIGGPVARHKIIVRRAPVVENAHGNEVRDWAAAVSTESAGWAVDAGPTSESGDGRDGIVTELTLRGPPNADILPSDRVIVFGRTYKIDGQVLAQNGPSLLTSHVIVHLVHVSG